MADLYISDELQLPLDAVTQTFAILAQRRKGKTYTANVIAEEMVEAGIPWVALDPTGAWWGLRSSADGKQPGIPVIVLGGDHGDLPLERTAGKMVADLVVDNPGWYILDMSSFTSKEAERQFATDFAEAFYRGKSRNKAPMHLFVDEADMFAPQQSPSGDKRMLGAFEAIVRRGGIRGIGTTLISQRAAVLNKNVLEQIDTLIVLRTVGPNDRKAIAGYVEANGTLEQQRELMGSVASLDLGEAWIWSPGEDLFKRVQIRRRNTFNSSATPKAGDTPIQPVSFAKVDLDKVRKQMEATIKQVKSDDPIELKRQIGVLKSKLADQEPKVVEKEVRVPVLAATEINAIQDTAADLMRLGQNIISALDRWLRPVEKEFGQFSIDYVESDSPVVPDTHIPIGSNAMVMKAKRDLGPGLVTSDDFEPMPTSSHDGGLQLESVTTDLHKGELRMLQVIGRSWPLRLTKAQMAVMAKMKITGGTFSTYYKRLKREGYLAEMADGTIEPSDKALAEVGVSRNQAPKSPAERLMMWREVLPAGAQRLLDSLVEHQGSYITRSLLAEKNGFAVSGGTFGAYLGMLRRNGIAEIDGDVVALAEDLRSE